MKVKIVGLIIILFFMSSCSTFKKDKDESEQIVSSSKADSSTNVKKSEDYNLIITRLYAKIDDLKQTIKKQEAKIQVLEKSIVLGITPEEYLKEFNSKQDNNLEVALLEEDSSDITSLKSIDDDSNSNNEDNDSVTVASSKDQESYDKHIMYAEEMYNSGNFGRAIVEYSDILKRYPSKVDGSVYYWIGMCWYNLKEYRLSQESLNKFIQEFASNEYVPDAKLTIALCYQEQGFSEKAIKDLKNIIKEYPNHNVSKKAQQQIITIGKD